MSEDFTPTGLKIEGTYENSRNTKNRALFADMIKEAYDTDQVIVAHHLVYVAIEKRWEDGKEFEYQIVEEIPSADTLIFDHDAAMKIWGRNWRDVLYQLAMLPVDERDQRLHDLYYSRKGH
jgi:hypothetical protein